MDLRMGPSALTPGQSYNVRHDIVRPKSISNTPRSGASSGTSGPITIAKFGL